MKGYIFDFVIGTIVAAILTLLSYLVGLDKSWEGAAETYGTCFFIYIALSLYQRIKKNKTT